MKDNYPERAVRRRILARAKRVSIEAHALERRIKKTYIGADHLIFAAAQLVEHADRIASWIDGELKRSKVVRYG